MTKGELQNSILEYKDAKLIILEWATGLGKSFGALKLVKEIKPRNILLLVSEDNHKDNWLKEMDKFNSIYGFDPLDCNVSIECYASLKHYENTSWDIVILDEAHHVTSELRSEYLYSLNIKKTVVLSATLTSNDLDIIKDALKIRLRDIYHSKIDLELAIEWGAIPKPSVYLIPLVLKDNVRDQVVKESRGIKSKMRNITCNYLEYWRYKKDKKNYPNLSITVFCTEKEKLEYLDSQIEFYKRMYMINRQDFMKDKWMRLGSERKRYLGELKTDKVKLLIKKLKGKRLICFCTSITQAEELGKSKAIHSKNSKSKEILEEFQSGKINKIYCVGKLVEGQNLNNIEAGIIVQLDGKERPFIQKHGRILRSEDPLQYIFYYKNTRDEDYLNNILEGINPDNITVIENF